MLWKPPRRVEKYVLIEPLGRGGMGRVFLYWDTRLQRKVAIKFPSTLDSRTEFQVLEKARAAAVIQHPNVVETYEYSFHKRDPFIVFEYIRGRCLNEILPLKCTGQVLNIAIQLARGPVAAHEEGVIHGDIKPSNSMITNTNGLVKLIDFGLAKRTRRPEYEINVSFDDGLSDGLNLIDSEVMHRRTRFGTESYMAPEMNERTLGTVLSDIYAFGVMLHELCTGQVLLSTEMAAIESFRGNDDGRKMVMNLRRYGLFHEIQSELACIILRCVAKEPKNRYRDARRLLGQLLKIEIDVEFETQSEGGVDFFTHLDDTYGYCLRVDKQR